MELVRRYSQSIRQTVFDEEAMWLCVRVIGAGRKGYPPDESVYEVDPKDSCDFSSERFEQLAQIAASISSEYRDVLSRNNVLTFDDLIKGAVEIQRTIPELQRQYEHIVTDEYQDTSRTQYEFLRTRLGSGQGLTVVGDPDQYIYEWAGADIRNFERMRQDFPDTIQIALEKNYRSTASILRSATAVISQDKNRIPKALYTDNIDGFLPTLSTRISVADEASFLAQEIERLLTPVGGSLFNGNDVAILVRSRHQVHEIVEALKERNIPYRVLTNRECVEPEQIKHIIACLRYVANPYDANALTDMVKFDAPGGRSKGIGPKTIFVILQEAERCGVHSLEVIKRICNKDFNIPRFRHNLYPLMELVEELHRMTMRNIPASELIFHLVQRTDLVNRLQEDDPRSWYRHTRKIESLVEFACCIEDGKGDHVIRPLFRDNPDTAGYPLRMFLQVYALASPVGSAIRAEWSSGNDGAPKVTVMTSHLAKGLEWPIVMIPGVNNKRFFKDEELRRVLYVAFTRAQTLLFVTHSQTQSEFISKCPNKQILFQDKVPDLDDAALSEIAQLLGRAALGEGWERGDEQRPSDDHEGYRRFTSGRVIRNLSAFTAENLMSRLQSKMKG
ncbi:P-loop containing nucleoside triphosphate hydrolase protein [Obba rivulosa]|uniref:DNA 3'-5' helicase n=1 Tax=Obba rivulosa TaxID=1052685 RepID=A0A8E2J433_9APHY|nr:P-loop containing nucleoside triphosphate hydrolase protein [Obba rivulosa]